jgi:integrase/recombinase XerC
MLHLNGFFAYLQFEKRYSKHTLEAYRHDLQQLGEFLQENAIHAGPEYTELQHRQVRSWVMHLMSTGMQPKSVHRKISSLRTYFRYLLKKGVISKNPMTKVVVPKTGKPLPLFVDAAGIEEMFSMIRQGYPEENALQQFEKARDLLMLDLLYKSGIRRSELIGLTESAFDYSAKQMKVLGKGNKERIIPVSESTFQMLSKYLALRNALFGPQKPLLLTNQGKPAYPNLIYRIVNRAMQGATTLTRKSPHIMRHTFATHLSNNGAELNAVKELLGHASLASTQVYTHNSIDRLKEIYKKAHPKG